MIDVPVYRLERTFNAPRERVWWAWTDPEPLSHWFGPNVETVIHQLDLKPQGLWLCTMNMGKTSSRQRAEYIEVVPPERLVWFHSWADENWNVAASTMPNWPKTLLSTLTLEPAGSATKILFTWSPHEATDAEIEGFSNALAHLDQGWAAGMNLLDSLL